MESDKDECHLVVVLGAGDRRVQWHWAECGASGGNARGQGDAGGQECGQTAEGQGGGGECLCQAGG